MRNLNEGWGARWRRGNCMQGTVNCQHTWLVELINKLATKPYLSVTLALQFLCKRYEGTSTPCKFCDYIQVNNGAGLQDVLRAASSYPS
jgi:hypothetical protein